MKNRKKVKSRKNKKASEKKLSFKNILFPVFLIVILPLVNYSNALDRTLMPQLFALSVFLLVYVSFVYFFFKNPVIRKNRIKNGVFLFAAVYLFFTIVSSFFAVNFKESLFDITKTSVFLAIVIFTLHQLEEKPRLLSFLPDLFLISGMLLLAGGYYQYFTLVLPSREDFLPDGRSIVYLVTGFMAHKNLYASALFMQLPFLAWGFWMNKGTRRMLFGVISGGVLIMLLLLSTRAVWMGTLVAGFSMVAVLILKSNQFGLPSKFRLYSSVAILAVIIAGGVFVAANQSSSEFTVADRFRSIFDPEASNNRYRLNVWEASLEMWKEEPFFGVGSGNWKVRIPPYFYQYNFNKEQLNWFRPHNDFIWVLSEKGVAGFLAFIALFVVSVIYLFRIINRSGDKNYKILSLLLGGGLTGYLAISFFDFPLERIYHQTLLAIWLATIIYLEQISGRQTNEPVRSGKYQSGWSLFFGAILLWASIYSYNATQLEVVVKKAQVAKDEARWPELFAIASTIPTRFRDIDSQVTPVHYFHGLAKEHMKQYNDAEEYYLQALEEHPTKIQVINNLGLVYFYKDELEQSKKYLTMALEILPGYYEALVNLSAVYAKEGNFRESLEYLRRVPREQWDERFYQREKVLLGLINKDN